MLISSRISALQALLDTQPSNSPAAYDLIKALAIAQTANGAVSTGTVSASLATQITAAQARLAALSDSDPQVYDLLQTLSTLQLADGLQSALSASGPTSGDFKYSYQSADHAGWIRLDGRLKAALTTNQQAAATALGIGANLPNIADKSPVGVSGTKPLNSIGGASSVSIAQANLPNINLTGGSHGHSINDSGHTHGFAQTGDTIPVGGSGNTTRRADQYTINVTSSFTGISINSSGNLSIPLGGSGTAVNTQNPYLALNGFIYLGS